MDGVCVISFFRGHYYQSGVMLHWLKCPDVKKGHEVLQELALYKVIGEGTKREQGEARTGGNSFWSHFYSKMQQRITENTQSILHSIINKR